MTPPRLPFVFALLLLFPHPLFAASFPCGAAHTSREKAICASRELSALDDQLARAYKASRAELSPASAALVQKDQREWLTWLDRICTGTGKQPDDQPNCLKEHYTSRLQQFTTGQQHLAGRLFYTRAHFVFVPSPPTEGQKDPNQDGPGFGYGEFAWPQIDLPGPNEVAWNAAIRDAALKAQGDRGKGKSPDFDRAVTPEGSLSGSFTLLAVNQRLISTDLERYGYSWGGAHGNTDASTFSWWLDQRRPLRTEDVFLPGSGWQPKLARLTQRALLNGTGADNLWTGKELNDGVDGSVRDPSSWGLGSAGLTISFAQYAVGPYSSGMPSATLPWKQLQPMLNPALHPETLPRRLVPLDQ